MENEEISLESAPVTVRRMEKASYEFVVEKYSLRRAKKLIQSNQFVVGGRPWTICLYPHGKGVAACNDGYVSLYIKNDGTQSVEFVFELYIVDQSGKGIVWGMSSFKGRETFRLVQSLKHNNMARNPQFISQARLESPDYGYLIDDRVKIVAAVIGVFSYHHRIQNQPPLDETDGADFDKLLQRKVWDDEFVFFKVADQRFCAEKSIIAAQCPALLSGLPDAHQLQDIVIPDTEPDIFKALLWFIYYGTLNKEHEKAISNSSPFDLNSFAARMLAAADQFQFKSLKGTCESRILEQVSGDSVGYLLHVAEISHAAELKSACLRFAAGNHAAIMESDGCEYLKESCLLLFLDLAGFSAYPSTKDDLCTSREGVLNLCNKVLSTFKGSLVYKQWPWFGFLPYKKLKEV